MKLKLKETKEDLVKFYARVFYGEVCFKDKRHGTIGLTSTTTPKQPKLSIKETFKDVLWSSLFYLLLMLQWGGNQPIETYNI